MNGIEVNEVFASYGDVPALSGATLHVPVGSVCGLIGMNGAGKSTLFKSIVGAITPDSGTVRVLGGAPSLARKRSLISYVPQNEAVDWTFPMSVEDVVMTGRYGQMGFTRRPRATDRDVVAGALEQVGLTDLAQRQIGQLSGGQRKRAFVARGIAQGAEVLLLDEPFAGVDQVSAATIATLIRGIADRGATVLVSTHDLPTLPTYADQAALLLRKILMVGSPEIVLEPQNLALAFGMEQQ